MPYGPIVATNQRSYRQRPCRAALRRSVRVAVLSSPLALLGTAQRRLQGWAVALVVLGFASAVPLQAQQFRAAWADVFHSGMQNASQVDTMLSNLVAGHYNAVIVQVLAYMDSAASSHGAYWQSSIVPWSGFTTTNFDPLAYVCKGRTPGTSKSMPGSGAAAAPCIASRPRGRRRETPISSPSG